MSSSSSVPNGNDDQPQPAPKKVKANNFYCFFNNGAGNQMINVPSPANSSFVFTGSSAVRPVTAHMLRPSPPPGSEIQRRVSLYNQRMPAQLTQNQQQPHVQQGHQPLLQQALPRKQHQPVQRVQQQVSLDENLRILNEGVSSEEEAVRAGLRGNTVKKSIHMEFSFDNFPYYLSERTKHHLVASYYMHMKHKVQRSRPKLQRTGHRVLLSGPEGSEIYQEVLAMALTHHFGVKLLMFDCHMNLSDLSAFGRPPSNDALRFHLHPALKYLSTKHPPRSINIPNFSNATSESSVSQIALPPLYEKSQSQAFKIGDRVIFTGLKYGSICSNIASRGPSFGNRGEVLILNNNSKGVGVRFDMPIPEGNDLGGLCEACHGFFCDGNEVCIDVEDEIKPIFTLFQGFCAESRLIVFVKHAESCLIENFEAYQGMNSMVNKLPDNVFVIGSHIQKECTKQKENFYGTKEKEQKFQNTMKLLLNVFPDKISIEMPEDQKLFDKLKCQLNRDAELLKVRENMARLKHVLIEHELECKDIETVQVTDQKLTEENAEKVVKWALGRELMAHPRNNSNLKLVISQESIVYGLDNLRAIQTNQNNSGAFPKDIPTDNEFEKRILEDVILHNEIGVKFDDIGALDNIKDALKEVVILPLKRPELFCKGQLRKLCRGILLFGPPGTGKTMLAKAVATEAGANFFNISTSIISSKWYGDSEKFVKALSSLASKIAPSVLFIDEVDSFFGKRKDVGHEVMCKIKNDFMLYWDGLHSKDMENVLVLAATNRPFDLDEAVIRRMSRRFMVNLPDVPNRSNILKVILANEDLLQDVDFNAIALMTNGFSGNDLKNLCIAAAHRPVREIMKKDKLKSPQVAADGKQVEIRPLNMEDFKYGYDQVKGSVSHGWRSMAEMLQWNSLYGGGGGGGGGGGSRGNPPLSYYI